MYIQIKYSLKLIFPFSVIRNSSNFSKSNLKKLLESMPKEPKHIADAQKHRLKLKEKFQKYVPGKVTLQVLGTGAEGAPKSLYMFTDQSRYLFNCGEGTQRLAHEHKMKLSKLEHIFITYPSWDNIGGLPGVSLTIQDVGVPQITLHGPEGLDELFIATRRFVVLKDLSIRMADCNPEEVFQDNVMSVSYVPIHKSEISTEPEESPLLTNNEKAVQVIYNTSEASTSTRSDKKKRRSRSLSQNHRKSIEDDDVDYYAYETTGTRSTLQTLSFEMANTDREQNISMCYICRLNPRPGALSLEKCVEAGVTPGPLLGQLKAGKDIVLNDGRVVKSKDVCLPDDPGPIIIIADCPSEHYLQSFVNNPEFKKYQMTANNDDDLAYIVVHFTPSHIMKTKSYRKWIDQFSLSTQHLALNDANHCMGSVAVHRIQYKLNMLHEGMFPLLGDTGTEIDRFSETPLVKKQKTESINELNNTDSATTSFNESLKLNFASNICIQPNTFCNIYLRPKKGIDRSEELKLVPAQYYDETLAVEGFPEALKRLKRELEEHKKPDLQKYPRVLFLGTGSCIPNKTRNTSGILVETSEVSNFLMDCGEGTYGQIVRFFGYEKARKILINLKAVYISHLHADHHIGLVGLLKGRRKAFEKLHVKPQPILLLAPRQILSWLEFYHRRFENISDEYRLLANGDMIFGDCKLSTEQKQNIKTNLGMTLINTVLVRHCPNAFGVTFVHKDGWKLTYSGDTMPSDNLVTLGTYSDLLIHEATMEDELSHEAISKMHSTTSQAIEIGQKMKAKHILLTHFSQRYAKLPRFNDNFAANVGIAFDNMQISLDELPLLPLLYPALKLMFAEHYEELEHKAVKRQMKSERRETSLDRHQTVK